MNLVCQRVPRPEVGVPVLCYGLRGDFMTQSFPGSMRLLEIAHSIEELKTICRCGRCYIDKVGPVQHA